MQHTLFVHFFAVVLHHYNLKLSETSWLHVLWRKCRTCRCSLFFHCRYKLFMLFFPQKSLLCLLFLALAICCPFFLWVSLACRLLSLFLSHFLSLYSKFVDMTINLSLILRQHRYRNNFRFPFSSLLTLWLSLLHKTGLATRFPAKITSSHHTCWLSYFALVCLWCGRTVGRSGVRSRDYQNFSDR